MILSLAIGIAIGLLTGFVTGYIFERRSRSHVEAENLRLRDELERLRIGIYNAGSDTEPRRPPAEPTDDLPGDVLHRVRASQDSGGLVRRRDLLAYFVER